MFTLHLKLWEGKGLLAPPKISMSPEQWWLEDDFPFEMVPFRRHVNFGGCNNISRFVGGPCTNMMFVNKN